MKSLAVNERIHQVYAAFNKRALEEVLSYLHPDVHWPNGWEGGYVEGHTGVRDYWARQWAVLDPEVVPLSIEPLEDGRIKVLVQQTVKDSQGKLLSANTVKHLYTFDSGLIRTMEIEPTGDPGSR